MLIAEDLLLLLTDDASGRLLVPGDQADAALGGANLVELTLLGKVDLSGPGDTGKPGSILVRDPSPPATTCWARHCRPCSSTRAVSRPL